MNKQAFIKLYFAQMRQFCDYCGKQSEYISKDSKAFMEKECDTQDSAAYTTRLYLCQKCYDELPS